MANPPKSKEGFLWTPSETFHGVPTESVVSDSGSIGSSYDVIVLGAGFAGLTAARDLGKTMRVLLLDARDRIGGRTWTAKVLGQEFEMGGTWVHWRQPHVYSELVRYNLHKNLKTTNGAFSAQDVFFKKSKGVIERQDLAQYEARINAMIEAFFTIDGVKLQEYLPRPHEPLRNPEIYAKYDVLSAQDRLDQLNFPPEDKEIFASMVATFGLDDPAKTGFMEAANWFALSGCNAQAINEYCSSYKLGNGGTTSLAVAMLEDYGGDIVLNAIVQAVEEDENGVLITLKDGRFFRGECSISTIPLNVLSDIKFSPPLSDKKQQAAGIGHITRGSKVHFEIDHRPAFFSSSSFPAPFGFTFSDHNGSTDKHTYCIGFANNGHLPSLEDSVEVIKRYQELVPDAQVSAYLTHNWLADPYAKGAWCCYGQEFASKYMAALQEPHGRVLMASSDWADGWRGFIDGAIEQGTRAATDARRLLEETQKGRFKVPYKFRGNL